VEKIVLFSKRGASVRVLAICFF